MSFAPERPPLRFVTPPDWPQPSPSWVARNQGWQPPVNWLPPVGQPGVVLRPAPPTWQFWVEDPEGWPEYRAAFAKPVHRTLLIGAILFGVGAIVTLMGYLGELGTTFLILWGAIIFGGIRLIRGFVNLRRIDQTARAALGVHARQVRAQLDQSAYPQYLDRTAHDRATTGRPAMTLDEFGIARDAEPWTMPTGAPGSWSPQIAGVVAPGVSWTSPTPLPAGPVRSRRFLWVTLGITAAFLVGIIVPVAVAASHANASGASGAHTAVSITDGRVTGGNYDLPDGSWNVDDQADCSNASGDCWTIVLNPPKTCSNLSITWGFSKTKTSDEAAVRTTTLSVVEGRKAEFSIPADSDLEPLQYIFYDTADCGD